ncbi:MAG: biotin--[acetyl-CoA-carboxylase] ligase [Tahibacter sp.]
MQPRDLLHALADGTPIHGSDLARRFGVTRAAVWKRIEELRSAGLAIEASSGAGYRLAAPIELLERERICVLLSPLQRASLGAFDLHWEIDSTNSELLRRAGSVPDLSLCVAESQTAGRGRRGRQWLSPPAGNVYLSVFKRFDKAMGELSGLSLAVGIAVAHALSDAGISGHGLKWPNDILTNGRKLAGVLVESGGEFLGPCHAVIGVGINIHLSALARSKIDQPATDLRDLCATLPSRNAVVAGLIGRLMEALQEFSRHGFAAFQDDFAHFDLLRGVALEVSDVRGTHAGIGAGVDARGALRVQQGDAMVCYDSAEISVRGKGVSE